MFQNQKTIKPKKGRPKSKKEPPNNLVQTQDEPHQYLAENYDCLQIFFLFATQGKFKITIQTGRKKNSQLVDNIQKKKVMEQIEETFRLYNFQELKYFFLSDHVKKFSFENNLIKDNTIYRRIDHSQYIDQFYYLIQILNVVFEELDPKFIVELEKIVQYYYHFVINLIDYDQIAKAILQVIKNPKNHADFQYLLLWNNIKKLIKDVQKQYDENKIQQLKEKVNQNKTSQKVIKKHEIYIRSLESELKLKNQEPIDYLITKLINIFNNVIKQK